LIQKFLQSREFNHRVTKSRSFVGRARTGTNSLQKSLLLINVPYVSPPSTALSGEDDSSVSIAAFRNNGMA